jgi:hypothetical protein
MTDSSMIPLHDGPDDDALRTVLRAASPSPALDAARLQALQSRIAASAASRFAARSAPPSWLDVAARWSRAVIQTSAVAAGLGVIAVLSSSRSTSGTGDVAVGTSTAASAGTDTSSSASLEMALWRTGAGISTSDDLIARMNGLTTTSGGLAAAGAK